MTSEKMSSARGAIDRGLIIYSLAQTDEMFYRFATTSELVQPWTNDPRLLSRSLSNLYAGGGTAMYDAIADAIPVAQGGRNPKKALVVISDGNDTSSRIGVSELRQIIRESEVLVYAIGVDSDERDVYVGRAPIPRVPFPFPFPIPGRRQLPRIPPGGEWRRVDPQHQRAGQCGAPRSITGRHWRPHRNRQRHRRPGAGATARIADEATATTLDMRALEKD